MSRVKEKIKNKKKISYSFRLFFLFLVLVFACIAFMHSSYFAVTDVKIEGIKYLTERQVLELCEIEKGTNIFSLNYKNLTKRLRTNCWVEEVEIKRRLPGKVIIRIKEREPLATLIIAQKFINVDKQGVALSNDVFCQDNLPLITGVSYQGKVIPGRQITGNNLKQVLNSCSLLGEGILSKISEINLQQKDNLLIYMIDGLEIRLGGYVDLEKKMKILIPLLQDSQMKNSAIEYVDMRFDRPVIKWR